MNVLKPEIVELINTVQEVTWMVGYSHTGYFIELFRKHYGISPGEMLKNNR